MGAATAVPTGLQMAWFILFMVLITGYAILDGFDLGVGMISLLARDDEERRGHMNAIGPVWDGNEVWLLTVGGALFAAFPSVYATVFSGFYLALMLLLVALILRAVSLEFRSKVEAPAWRRVWDVCFVLGSFLATLLFGVAVGNILRGVPLTADGEFAGTFLGLLHPYPVAIGLLTLTMFATHGSLYMGVKTEGEARSRHLRRAGSIWVAWVALYVVATLATFFVSPFLLEGVLRRLPFWPSLALTLGGLVCVPVFLKGGHALRAFLSSSAAIAGLIGLAATSLYPRLVPALGDLGLSLTAANASSTERTLTVMLVIALVGMPLVLGYTAFIYSRFKGKVVLDEQSY